MAKQKNPPKKKLEDADEDQDSKETESDSDQDDDDGDDEAEANRRINAIVTSRVKREMKSVNQTLLAMQETLKSLATPAKSDSTDDEDSDDLTDSKDSKKEAQVDPKLSKKLSRMERELADEKAARKKAEEERTQERERGLKAEMRTIFQSHLTEFGLTSPRLMRAALDQLEQDGVMFRDEDGKVRFKGQDKYGIETTFDPKVGLRAWVAGDGREFVPAVEASGSGTGGSVRGTGNSNQSFTQKDLKKMSAAQLASINLERACSGLPELEVGE